MRHFLNSKALANTRLGENGAKARLSTNLPHPQKAVDRVQGTSDHRRHENGARRAAGQVVQTTFENAPSAVPRTVCFRVHLHLNELRPLKVTLAKLQNWKSEKRAEGRPASLNSEL